MYPANFPEANAEMQPPKDAPEVLPLRVLRHSEGFVSKWKLTPVERLRALIFGSCFVYVMSDRLPPMNVQCKRRLQDRNLPK